ncbi:hypothetical protein FA95DRAFT_1613424 [Auriscalpium vulgare]|uniref:Uncharacterized protein n=1 Tax=Auriscalpium vulgare TaxID=40419 RepID=A0ACB8R3B8_9AGAM|nr:hypothetical protein FA95DRAFT_1613424 [Auriscalpium vulgare]
MSPASTTTFKQSAPTHVPILTPGIITPEVLRQWEHGALAYFKHKMIDPMNHDRLETLTFAKFLTEIRKNFLERDWESRVSAKLLNSQQGSGEFFLWYLELSALNSTLCDTDSFLDDKALQRKLSAGLHPKLGIAVTRARLSPSLSLLDWISEVADLDGARLTLAAEVAAEVAHPARPSTASATYTQKPRPSTSTSSASGTAPGTSSTAHVLLPKLTAAERDLLNHYNGCFKCRGFHAGHRSSECPNRFPSGDGYRALSVD